MKKILSLFAAVLFAFAVNAATTTVNPTNFKNNLRTAVTSASAGDVLELTDGIFYEEGNFDIKKDLTIKAAAGAHPVIANLYYFRVEGDAKVTFQGIEFDGAIYKNGESADVTGASDHCIRSYKAAGGNEEVTLEDCEFHGYKSYVLYTHSEARKWKSLVVRNCYFHNNVKHSIAATHEASGGSSCDEIIIENSTFAHTTGSYNAIYVADGNTTTLSVDHCTFYNYGSSFISTGASVTDVAISNSIFANPSAKSTVPTTCASGTITNCLTNNTGDFTTGPTITGCITGDPKFKDPDNEDVSKIDFTLAGDSPAIDKGSDDKTLGDPRWWPAAEEPADGLKLYLRLSSDWAGWPARYAIYTWKEGVGDLWVAMDEVEGEENLYTASIPEDNDKLIFVRLNGETEPMDWDNKWSQTVNLDLPTGDNNLFTVTSGGIGSECNGEWSKYEYVEPETPAKFYITGNAALVGEELKWNPAAIKSEEDSYTLSLKADVDYMLKLTLNGTWEGDNNVKGFDALTVVADGLTRGEDDNNDNICFKLAEDGDVTVTYKVVEDVVTFKLEGNFYVAPVAKYYIAGSMTDWEENMIPVYEDSYVLELEAGDHKLKVVDGGIWLGYIALTEKAEGLSKDDDGNICFTLAKAGNVTVTYGNDVFTVEGNFYINPWESWFTGPNDWDGETDSKLVYDQENKKATITIAQDKNAQWKAQAMYQGLLTENGKFYHVGLKIKANHALSGVTIKWENNTGILMENASISLEEATEFVYDKPLVHVTKAGGDGVLVLDFGQAKTGDVIEIYDVVIEEVDAPVVDLEDGYYLIGLKGWTIYDLAAADKFAQGETEGEYELELALANGDEFKVVTIIDNQFGAWFPGEAGNYHVDLAHAGDAKTVYFRPDYSGNEDWHAGCIFVHPNEVPFDPIVNTIFAEPSWDKDTESSAVWDSENKKVTVTIAIDKVQQWQAQVFFQTIIPSAGKWYRFSVKLKANNDIENVTIKYQDNAEMFYDPNVALEKDVVLEFVKVVPGLAGSGIIVYDFGYAKAGDVIEIYDLSVEEIDAPALNYYVAGTINDWAIADDQYEFEANEQAEGEFIAHAELVAGAEFKVVSVQGDKVVWFPGDDPGNYVVDAAHAGVVTIYFRPNYDGGEGWHGGCIFVQKDQTTGIENADAAVKAMKLIENGQLIIIRDGNRYNALGQKF